MMQTGSGSLKFADDCPHSPIHAGLTCDECGKTYTRPILARVSTAGNVQRYQACPHCLTKVPDNEITIKQQGKSSVFSRDPKQTESQSEGSIKCSHFFGYLGKRQKDTPIPERCLVCNKMVECLYG